MRFSRVNYLPSLSINHVTVNNDLEKLPRDHSCLDKDENLLSPGLR